MISSNYIVQVKNLSKYFPGVVALDSIDLGIKENTVHCIVGENGAGKSTFIKVLTGAYPRSEGEVYLNGEEYFPKNVKDAMDLGMSMLFQELNIVEHLSVEDNLTLGHEDQKFGIIHTKRPSQKTIDILKSLDPDIKLRQNLTELSFAQRQLIEITKALARDSRIIIMDEPTAALSEEETNKLLKIVSELKHKNITVIYITHRLDEIFKVGDRVTVFRDGKIVGDKDVSEVQGTQELVKMMLGKVVVETYSHREVSPEIVLKVEDLKNNKLKNISFELKKGEILGVYGLVGAGKSELARALCGADEKEGVIFVENQKYDINSPRFAIKSGIAMVPEERRAEGIFTELSIRDNIPLMNMKNVSRNGIMDYRKEKNLSLEYIKKLQIATTDETQLVGLLSGGNQQKVVIAKTLNSESKILLLDEPTRGIDVGAKEEIHKIIRDLSEEGMSFIIFSSELPEIVNLCDRIVVMNEGRICATIDNQIDLDVETIFKSMTGEVVNEN